MCPACLAAWDFIAPPFCDRCGAPAAAPGTCPLCAAHPPEFLRNRALLVYDDIVKSVIYKFKYGDRPGYARGLAALLARRMGDAFAGVDFLAPAPMHRQKLRRRGYNQAALLARAVGRATGLPVLPDALVRLRDTQAQAGLTRSARENNTRGAFKANPQYPLAGKTVLLVDDIYTTGSTLRACAQALGVFPGVKVSCVTLALTPPHGDAGGSKPRDSC
jgi:ComF family protein